LPLDIQNTARKKLRMMNNAQNLNDLKIPPNNRLEALKGNLSGFYSIRIINSGGFVSSRPMGIVGK